MTFIQAVNQALSHDLADRPEVVVYGEDIGKAGGIFAAARNLQRDFGDQRVFDTPIAESAILGSAVGAALCGMKPVVEIMWADFLLVALDQIINQAANVRYVTGGRCGAPIVVRTQQGVTPGSCAQHSQSLEALLAHIPGLRVAMPATPQDAYDILRAAIASPDPCIVIESRAEYQIKGEVDFTAKQDTIGGARLAREGTDGLIVTWGPMLRPSLAAAAALQAEGLEVAVLDLRWLAPLDLPALVAATQGAGGRVAIVHEANLTGGFGAEVAAKLHETWSGASALTVLRIATPDARIPAAPVLQRALVPDAGVIADRVRVLLKGG
jgi:2-oxoisovalerate dehydrogenase E1 component